ncbi:MAG: FAD:protein FMN transferase [Puniceicoccaceae bacterium]|nr:MAG: FAD:protein FMN transferase [Puniceicoccaceae bacterium]
MSNFHEACAPTCPSSSSCTTNAGISGYNPMTNKRYHSQTHEAMKTVFQVRLLADDAKLAEQTARACVERIDAIEASLSRYIPGSDVWQINHMEAGQSLFIREDCEECLRLAMLAAGATSGLFDVTLGRLIEHQKSAPAGDRPELVGQLMLDPERPMVHCNEAGREIDLGGIGKGFALDMLASLCQEWGIRGGLLSAGASTQLAFGEAKWDITLKGDRHTTVVSLKDAALSASGTSIQGSHIVSPQDGGIDYVHKRAWVRTTSAAMADAFSTAALLATDLSQIQCSSLPVECFVESETGIHPI